MSVSLEKILPLKGDRWLHFDINIIFFRLEYIFWKYSVCLKHDALFAI